jgi:hypothetical protein
MYHRLVTLCLYHEARREVKGGGDAEGDGGGLCTKTDKLEIYFRDLARTDKQIIQLWLAEHSVSH